MERWNNGFWESGQMGKWNIGNIPLDNVVKNIHQKRNSFINQYSTIPLFHYSIIPWVRQNHQASINTHNFNEL
jgi:hypothetical protein